MRQGQKLFIWKCAGDCCGGGVLHWRAGVDKHRPFAHFTNFDRALIYLRTVWFA